jgi:hypothetical protein
MMYGIYPFEVEEALAEAITRGDMKEPSQEIQKFYSEGLRKILLSLLSQVCFIFFCEEENCFNVEPIRSSNYKRSY